MKKLEKELTLVETILACIIPIIAMIITRDFVKTLAWTALTEKVIYPLAKYLIYVLLEDHREQMIEEGTY